MTRRETAKATGRGEERQSCFLRGATDDVINGSRRNQKPVLKTSFSRLPFYSINQYFHQFFVAPRHEMICAVGKRVGEWAFCHSGAGCPRQSRAPFPLKLSFELKRILENGRMLRIMTATNRFRAIEAEATRGRTCIAQKLEYAKVRSRKKHFTFTRCS